MQCFANSEWNRSINGNWDAYFWVVVPFMYNVYSCTGHGHCLSELCTSAKTWKNCRKARWPGERVKVWYFADDEGCFNYELTGGAEPVDEETGFCESLHPKW